MTKAVLLNWLHRHQIAEIRVISPHLDDAAFSATALLGNADIPGRHVYTTITAADLETDASWATANNFSNPQEEFEARRNEDSAAMQVLGVPYVHCGMISGSNGPESAELVSKSVFEPAPPARTLILLPLGAGGQESPTQSFMKRLTRKPFGSPIHGDHLWVRDTIEAAATKQPNCIIGYYAETPYQFANTSQALQNLAKARFQGQFEKLSLTPDAAFKHKVASCYTSQLTAEFGTSRDYQMKVCAQPELIFLPRSA